MPELPVNKKLCHDSIVYTGPLFSTSLANIAQLTRMEFTFRRRWMEIYFYMFTLSQIMKG